MTQDQDIQNEVLKTLKEIDFPKKYYSFFEQIRGNSDVYAIKREEMASSLAATGKNFTYQKRERFFACAEKYDSFQIGLNVAFSNSTIDFILTVEKDHEEYGDPFSALAHDTMTLINPDFKYNPAYPNLPASSHEDLQMIILFGVDLFEEFKNAFIKHINHSD